MPNLKSAIVAALTAMFAASHAHAALVISNKPTQNVTCLRVKCTATASSAVLNVTDLANFLGASRLTIRSGSLAQDIVFKAAFSWTSSNPLTLSARRSIKIDAPLSNSGPGALTLMTNDGVAFGAGNGTLSFGKNGHINFLDISNSLSINNLSYTLVDSISLLANDVAANKNRPYALARSYDAAADGVYPGAPVSELDGNFEGLGNAISNLTIRSNAKNPVVGLFTDLFRGLTENLILNKVNIRGHRPGGFVGALSAATNVNRIRHVSVSGKVEGGSGSIVGGLIGQDNQSIIENCSANVAVSAGIRSMVGGLVGSGSSLGINRYRIVSSYTEGTVAGAGKSDVGGLVGYNQIKIDNSYSMAAASGGPFANVGGLMGTNIPNDTGVTFFVTASYASGAVSGGLESFLGGFVGDDLTFGSIRGDYWDVNTSGQAEGVGNINENGIIGLTTEEFQSGLPAGFDPKVWAENPTINNGYPYLIANPPQ